MAAEDMNMYYNSQSFGKLAFLIELTVFSPTI